MSVGTQRLREDADRLRAGAIAKREDPAVVEVDALGLAPAAEHGVDLDAVAVAGREICAALGREPASKVAQAMKAKLAA